METAVWAQPSVQSAPSAQPLSPEQAAPLPGQALSAAMETKKKDPSPAVRTGDLSQSPLIQAKQSAAAVSQRPPCRLVRAFGGAM